MPLRRRLTLFFVLIVVLPLSAAALVLRGIVVEEVERRSLLALEPPLQSTAVLFRARAESIDDQVRAAMATPRLATLLIRRDRKLVDAHVELLRRRVDGLDFLAVRDRHGRLLAFSAGSGEFAGEPPSRADVADAPPGAGAGFIRTTDIRLTTTRGGTVGRAFGGLWVDAELLRSAVSEGVDLWLVDDGVVLAATAPVSPGAAVEVASEGPFDWSLGADATARARSLAGGMTVVASTPAGPLDWVATRITYLMIGLLLAVSVLAVVLAYTLARLITLPLQELAEAARAMGEGRFSQRIPVRSNDEVGQLAETFNEMSERLHHTIAALSTSRDQLERAVRRVGEMLRSTHDMDQILATLINMATDAVDAEAGVMWVLSPDKKELRPTRLARKIMSSLGSVPMGEGIVGRCAAGGASVIVPHPGAPEPAPGEPNTPSSIGVPVYAGNNLMGVIALYRLDPDDPFSERDHETVLFLSQQARVAIENVLLHEEAQRLSLTDSLTGIANRRYFEMQFRQVLATSTRFHRPFSLLMLDLDRFKDVNDVYGHQRGDATLIELAQRVAQVLREVDTFARYGGEEFICVLTETDLAGAATTAGKVLDAVRSYPFGATGQVPIRLTVSIGVAAFPEHGDALEALVQAADQALYRAKQEGRDRVEIAGNGEPNLRLAT